MIREMHTSLAGTAAVCHGGTPFRVSRHRFARAVEAEEWWCSFPHPKQLELAVSVVSRPVTWLGF